MHSENRMAESLLQQLLMKLQMLYKQLTSTDRLLAKLGVARDDIEMKQEEVRRAHNHSMLPTCTDVQPPAAAVVLASDAFSGCESTHFGGPLAIQSCRI